MGLANSNSASEIGFPTIYLFLPKISSKRLLALLTTELTSIFGMDDYGKPFGQEELR